MRLRVVCGSRVTMATLCPVRPFTSVDFPALGRPTIATVPDLKVIDAYDDSGRETRAHGRNVATHPTVGARTNWVDSENATGYAARAISAACAYSSRSSFL